MRAQVILLVEDNPDDRDLALLAFEQSKIANEVVVAENGVEALDYVFGTGVYAGRDAAEAPQVVLLDLNLPKLDGLEVLKRIRSDGRTKRLPVVILTSSDEERDMVESYERGANSYIRKPVDFAQFIEAVQQLGLYWLVLNEMPPAKAPREPAT
jgi:two-component system response regulator